MTKRETRTRTDSIRDGGASTAQPSPGTRAPDPFDLARFVSAQRGTFRQALVELRGGRKQSHWIWFVFPQIEGLGSSVLSRKYAISGLDEARAYLAHPLLGPRLIECAEAVLAVTGRSAYEIMGSPDDLKLRSCATLFARVAPAGSVFGRLLEKYFDARPDEETVRLLKRPVARPR